MKKLLPILKPAAQKERQIANGMFVEELFGSEDSPIIMYGEDNGNFIAYSPAKTEEEKKQIKEQALQNLAQIKIPYHIEKLDDFKIAIIQHEYAAEKILDKEFLKKLASDLNTSTIVVGIPQKGFMAAVAKGKGEANLYGATQKMYAQPQTYPISDALYFIIDGEIEMMGGKNQSGKIETEQETFDLTGQNDEKGKVRFIAKIGHKNEDGLADQIQKAFGLFMLQGMKDPKNINPKLDFHIDPSYTKLTPGLKKRIEKIAKNITERGGGLLIQELSKEKFKVRFFYGDNQLIAETGEPNTKQVGKTQNKSEKKPWWKFW